MDANRAFLFVLFTMALAHLTQTDESQPNIVFIVADDLGWNDVGWINRDMITPNLDKLAREGIIINQSYVMPVCSPSRSCFMSGRFPYHTGMQHGVIDSLQPYGLPLNLTTLPSLLKSAGYDTHMIGKWHQGFCSWAYTPTFRGFDSFYGFYMAGQDYYRHTLPLKSDGVDFRDDEMAVRNESGTYSTFLYTKRAERIISQHDTATPLFLYLAYQSVHEPLEVPKEYEDLYSHIKDDNRRVFSGMVSCMDESIGAVMKALEEKGMTNNTLVIFTSDNGGQVRRGGSNYPLRGNKCTIWEGGTRVPAFVSGNMLTKSGYTYPGMMHAVDWYPTVAEVAKAEQPGYEIDGTSLWQALNNNQSSPRNSFVYNLIKGKAKLWGAIRVGDWKLIYGKTFDGGWYPVPTAGDELPVDMLDQEGNVTRLRRELEQTEGPHPQYQLFNIKDDPTEHHELSKTYPNILAQVKAMLEKYAETEVRAMNPPNVEKADPKYWEGTWSPGWC